MNSKNKKVFIVYGPPLSGKTTYVKNRANDGDLVVDMDYIYQAISGLDLYTKPNNLLLNAKGLRDELINQIKVRYGDWETAYIIGGYPDKYERERLAKQLGAELVFCECSLEECISRVKGNRPLSWIEYIYRWFEKNPQEPPCLGL